MIIHEFTFIFMKQTFQLRSCFFLYLIRSSVLSSYVSSRGTSTSRDSDTTFICPIRSTNLDWFMSDSGLITLLHLTLRWVVLFYLSHTAHLWRLDRRLVSSSCWFSWRWSRLKTRYVHVLTCLSSKCTMYLGKTLSLTHLTITRLSSFPLHLSDNELLIRPEIWSSILSSPSLSIFTWSLWSKRT